MDSLANFMGKVQHTVSPRPYRSEQRDTAASETRTRIVEAAREILTAPTQGSFTMDAIAEHAGVARMTIYHQFGSKQGLVTALSDDLARRGGIWRLPEAFTSPDAVAGLRILIDVFTGMWATQGEVVRGLRRFSELNPEVGREDRNARRRRAITAVLERLAAERGRPRPDEVEDLADVLQVLTSVEAFESLSARGRDAEAVAELIFTTARALIEV
jgi:AcrR family transcriptional regulator